MILNVLFSTVYLEYSRQQINKIETNSLREQQGEEVRDDVVEKAARENDGCDAF